MASYIKMMPRPTSLISSVIVSPTKTIQAMPASTRKCLPPSANLLAILLYGVEESAFGVGANQEMSLLDSRIKSPSLILMVVALVAYYREESCPGMMIFSRSCLSTPPLSLIYPTLQS